MQFTESVIKEKARLVFVGRRENDQLVQELLYGAAYHALRGNTNPLNAILAEAEASRTTKLEGLFRWVKANLPIGMKDNQFKLNKGWVSAEVKSEEEFEKTVLPQLMKAAKWWEVAPKVRAQKEWDMDTYLNSVVDTLKKHGEDAAANEILAAKARIRVAA